MAFDLYAAQDYGFGTQDVTNPTDTINSYAKVTAINATAITVDDASAFNVGTEILLHDTSPGRWLIAFVTDKTGNVLTLNKDASTVWASLPNYLQAVTIPHYKTLTIQSGHSISPTAFSDGKGGIIAFKCNESFTLGGSVNLVDKGIPVADKSIRSLTYWESQAVADTDSYSGYENATMPHYVPLNSGDGLAFIITKKFIRKNNARIGNPNTAGLAYCRGNNHPDRPNVTNVGGSTIFICAETIQSFNAAMLAKYRDTSKSEGKGLARCYIASNTALANDEALYSYDIISDPTRLKSNCYINDFGDGKSSARTNPTKDVNIFAQVFSIYRKQIEYFNKSSTYTFPQGALIMVHFNNMTTSVTADSGRFYLTHVLSDDGYRLTVDADPPFTVDLDYYSAQIIHIPRCPAFTLNQIYNYTKEYDGKTGGIFAIAVKGVCDLRGGVIDMANKSGSGPNAGGETKNAPYNVDNKPMTFGNVYNHSRLPLGEGHGSIFILAKTLKLDGNTRLGATYTGNAFGGANRDSLSGGWQGVGDELAGSGKGGGHVNSNMDGYGGYGCNTYHYDGSAHKRLIYNGQQGAHLFIVADTIDGLTLANISTGGGADFPVQGGCQPGGAGYGGGAGNYSYDGGSGGYLGGGIQADGWSGGGGAGAAFIYANNVLNQSTGNII